MDGQLGSLGYNATGDPTSKGVQIANSLLGFTPYVLKLFGVGDTSQAIAAQNQQSSEYALALAKLNAQTDTQAQAAKQKNLITALVAVGVFGLIALLILRK